MGGLGRTMPITASGFVVGTLGVGLLPLGGFLGDARGGSLLVDAPWLVVVLLLVNGLTAFNLTRVFRLVFSGSPQVKTCRAPEVGWQMALPMMGLSNYFCTFHAAATDPAASHSQSQSYR